MHGKKLVVSLGRKEHPVGGQQMDANHRGEDAADEKENRHRDEIQQSDALVIGGQQPGADVAASRDQIMIARRFVGWCWRRVVHNLLLLRDWGNSGARGGAALGRYRDRLLAKNENNLYP